MNSAVNELSPNIFLYVLILRGFKAFKTEVLILRQLRTTFVYVLILLVLVLSE